jgi:hypothetical protein
MNFYAYCLSDEVTASAIDGARGVAGQPPRLIHLGAFRVVASSFDGERVQLTRENVLAHESVNRQALAETTPLPFRFGTVATEARLKNYVESHHQELLDQLARVRSAVEMSVKIIIGAGAENSRGRAEAPAAASGEIKAAGRGLAFLLAKQREIATSEEMRRQAAEIKAWLSERLGSSVREAVVELRAGESLILAAAHLVERARVDEYRERLKGARQERGELHFLTSGPWPPYSFSHPSF